MERGLFGTGNKLTAIAPLLLILGFHAPASQPAPLDSVQLARIGIPDDSGSRWTALPPDSVEAGTVLLRDGTQWERIDSARSARIPPPERWKLPIVPRPQDLLDWTTPPEGFALEWSFRRSRSRASSQLDRTILKASYDQPWKDWVSIGLVGGLERIHTKFELDSIADDPARQWWPTWGARACLRSLCWESRTAAAPIAEAAWTQRGMDSLARSGQDGDLVRGWSDPASADAWNWQHTATARIGVLQWRTAIDGDRWAGAEHEMLLSTATSGIVRWGALFGTNETRAWTGFALGIEPREFALPARLSLESSPVTFVFRYASNDCLSFEMRTALGIRTPWKLP
jgi:hypothetical protein